MCRASTAGGSLLAVVGGESDDDQQAAAAFKAWLLANIDFTAAGADPDECLTTIKNNDDLEGYVDNDEYNEDGFKKIAAAVVFEGSDLGQNKWNYQIRVNYTSPACEQGG